MKLRYGDLLQLLERLHALPRSRAIATESRLKNFSRLGFPNGPRVGSGERAEYGADQVVQLLVAFELLRLRMPPAVIAELVRTEWSAIAKAFVEAARMIERRHNGDAARRPILVVDATALHEAGKTVRRGELLSVIETIPADELLAIGARPWRSAMLIDPVAVIADAAAIAPGLRRSISTGAFVADLAALGEGTGMTAPGDWMEEGYSRRRALADALAGLRAAGPSWDETPPVVPVEAVRRVAAALRPGSPLADIRFESWTLDAAVAVYLHWIGAAEDEAVRKPTPAETLMIKTWADTPERLHEAMLDAVLAEIGAPVQDP